MTLNICFFYIYMLYSEHELFRLNQDLLELRPVIVGVANDHGLQFVGLKQLKNLSTAHLVKACIEALKQRRH